MKKLSERGIFEASITEEHVFKACRHLLVLNGARVHRHVERIPWGKKTSEIGTPDMYGWFLPFKLKWEPTGTPINHHVHFFIEIKKPGGRRRPSQERWIGEARLDGVIAFFADSVDAMVKGFAEYGIKLRGVS